MTAAATATATRLLAAGAILPAGTARDPQHPADRLDARAYRHGVLSQPVVRLVPAALAPGEDLVMEYLGCGVPGVASGVGERERRAPGFPGWALIHDPVHARHALEVVKRMKAAARRIRSKVGAAWDGFEAIAKELGRSTAHFLPSFWEEAGRMFGDAGNAHYAGRAFGKAREAEKVHALPVDLAALRESFLEFSLRGAVSAKALGEFAKALAAGHGATVAWETIRDLALRRCRGGVPPWAGMVDELRALARAARLDAPAELVRLLGELLPLPSARRAPAAFWTALDGEFVRMAGEPRCARMLLIDLLPQAGDAGSAYGRWWSDRLLALLSAHGLMAQLAAGRLADGTTVDPAAWLERAVRHGADELVGDRLLDVLVALAPALRDGRALRLICGEEHPLGDPDLLDLACELGVPLADPPSGMRISQEGWGGGRRRHRRGREDDDAARDAPPHPLRRRDPARLMADARYAQQLTWAIECELGNEDLAKLFATHPTLLRVAEDWARCKLDAAVDGSLPAVQELAEAFARCCTPPLFAQRPWIAARLAAVPVADALRRTLVTGLVDEFGWPALEQAVARLSVPPPASGKGGAKTKARAVAAVPVKIDGIAPFLVVRNVWHATVVGPAGVVLEHDFALAKDEVVDGCAWLDGQLLVAVRRGWSDHSIYWSGDPARRHPGQGPGEGPADHAQAALPGGGVTIGGRAIRAGDPASEVRAHALFGDGLTWWVREHDRGSSTTTLRELDPATGDRGRTSLPAWFEAGLEPGWNLAVDQSHLLPTTARPDAPLAVRDGVGGTRVLHQDGGGGTRLTAIDGRTVTVERAVHDLVALLSWPGTEEPRLLGRTYRAMLLCDAGGRPTAVGTAYARGQVATLPLPFWYGLQIRDAAASRRLRACTADEAAALLATAAEDLAQDADGSEDDDDLDLDWNDDDEVLLVDPAARWPRATAALRARFAITDRGLLAGLAGVGELAARLQARLAVLAGRTDAVDDAQDEAVGEGARHFGIEGLGWGGLEAPGRALASLGAWLAGDETVVPSEWLTWWRGRLRAGLTDALRQPAANDRAACAAFLRAFAAAGFDRLPGARRAGTVAFAEDHPPWGAAAHVRRSGGRILATLVDAGGNSFLVAHEDDEEEALVLEHAPDGRFRGLPSAAFLTVEPVTAPPPAALLLAAADCLERRVPPEPDAALLARASVQLGGTPAEAALLLHGHLPFARLRRPALRDLGLEPAAMDAAGQRLARLPDEVRVTCAEALLGDDPAGLWAMEVPAADGHSPLQRLAEAWRAATAGLVEVDFGPTASKREDAELRLALQQVACGRPPFTPRTAVLRAVRQSYGGTEIEPATGDDRPPLAAALLVEAVHAAAGAQLDLPAGNPSTALLARLVPQLDRGLADPRLVFPLATIGKEWGGADWKRLDRLRGGLPAVAPLRAEGREFAVHDDGLLLMVEADDDLAAFWHPAGCRGPADLQRLVQVLGDADEEEAGEELAGWSAWNDPAVRRLLLGDGGVPAGRFAADPRASAPATVAAAMARLKLAEDAATAYLQLLALPSPTATAMQRWNGWDARRLAAACAPLAAGKLVVEAKRAGAGRTVFLPGGWESGAPFDSPLESWKLPLLGIVRARGRARFRGPFGPVATIPLRPLGELFAAAWQRIIAGDAPRYEQVK